MTIIYVPTEACNYRCAYCFEPENQRCGLDIEYDAEAMKKSLKEVWDGPYGGSGLCLHGGEPTLIPRNELESQLEFLHSFSGAVSIVTNGSRIDDHMISLFKKYNVYVAISCDGPPELNTLRGPNPSDPTATAEYNRQLQDTIFRLREEGVWVSIMCILHKGNASTPEKLEKMKAWMLRLKTINIKGGRMNLMYASKSQKHRELTTGEATRAWVELYEFNKENSLHWNPFREMVSNILGAKLSPCVYNRCDVFSTHTLSILPDGTIGNCDRTFQNDIYLRSLSGNRSGRYEALQQTQCKACKYWSICGGSCPEEGTDGDWRNKTRFCQVIYNLYSRIERDLRGLMPNIRLVIDSGFDGNPFTDVVQTRAPPQIDFSAPLEGSDHGDSSHGDSGHGDATHGDSGHGDSTHGDSTHGDLSHGDSGHGDSTHGDSGHGDSTHGDSTHGDMAHGDSSHGDSPDWRR